MTYPTFSVVIPAYNAERTLRSTVESVLSQSDQDFEIVIVDDGSSDGTLRAMLDIASDDHRIRIVSQPNSGVSATRNYGAELAKGELLAFLDADDHWARDKLALHRKLHEVDPLIEASFARVGFCPDRAGTMGGERTISAMPDGYLSVSDVVVENAVCTMSNLVISRETFRELGGFDEHLRYAEDQELLVRFVGEGRLISGIGEMLVRYRMSEDGLSSDFEAMLEGWRSFAKRWIDDDELATAEAVYCRYLARRALRAGASIMTARSFARRGLAADRSAFMGSDARGFLTISGVWIGGMMPAALRRFAFA